MTCVHRWVIETPKGQYSDGKCRLCGEERQFKNWADLDAPVWHSTIIGRRTFYEAGL